MGMRDRQDFKPPNNSMKGNNLNQHANMWQAPIPMASPNQKVNYSMKKRKSVNKEPSQWVSSTRVPTD